MSGLSKRTLLALLLGALLATAAFADTETDALVHRNPKNLNPQPSTLSPQPEPSTLNPQPSTLNPQLHVQNPEP